MLKNIMINILKYSKNRLKKSISYATVYASLLIICLSFLLCSQSSAIEYDSITSDPLLENEEQKPEKNTELPFFGGNLDVKKDNSKESIVPFFGDSVVVDGKPFINEREKMKKNNAKFEIPEDAAERNDLSFLEGCWYFKKQEYFLDTPQRPSLGMVQMHYCFNKHGKGRIYVNLFKYNKKYSGPAIAKFDSNGDIVMENQTFRTNVFAVTRRIVRCKGKNTNTQCTEFRPEFTYLSKNNIIYLSRTP